MTLVGLLTAMSIMLVVLGATLDVFVNSERLNRTSQLRNDAQDRARVAIDGLARNLRNLASPADLTDPTTLGGKPLAVDVAGGDNLIFKTVNSVGPNTGANKSNIERVRYCVDHATGTLWRQEQTWTATAIAPAMPAGSDAAGAACPLTGTGWDTGKNVLLANKVANYARGLSRPVFTANTTSLADITSIHVKVILDIDPTRAPDETSLSSGVFLRNQNRYPTADFTWAISSDLTKALLNGSTSVDPEGDPLIYCWYETSAPTVAAPPKPCQPGPYIGTGITQSLPIGSGQTKNVYLEVWDSGLLNDKTDTKTITN